jgi:succinyl-diaminopimelate desuccinylase
VTEAQIDDGRWLGEEAVRLTRELVRIPSVYRPRQSPPATETAVADYVEAYLRDLGLAVVREEPEPGRPVLMTEIDSGRPGRTLLFEAHLDTVTEGDPTVWIHDPFAAELHEGILHGRGTTDTKGNLAAALAALRSLVQDAGPFAGRVVFCAPCDEEDRMLGIKHFIATGRAADIDGAIICEPEENHVCVAQKGAMRVGLTFSGRMAHGAMPYAGVNPIPRAASAVAAIAKIEAEEQDRHGSHPTLGWPTLTPTILQAPITGDPQFNVIPDSCFVAVDIRTIPGQDHELLIDRLRAAFDRLAAADHDFNVRLEVLEDRPWTETSVDDPLVVALAEAVRQETGSEPIFDGVPGTTDGTYLHLAGVPIVTTGAGRRDLPHQANEWVSVDELAATARIYRRGALLFLAGGIAE